jgi:serine/threonine protein kinase
MGVIEVGSIVGPYELKEKIGHGASASVFKAWHTELKRPVAIKFLPTMHDPLAVARFVREGRAMRRLDHPNIVQVLDTGEIKGTPYMVFDFIAGGSLAERMAAGPLPYPETMTILNGIAAGLDYAHRQGILHRDVKPANILLSETGAPVIADFGLARLLDQPSATATGILSGTPAYMSPEEGNGAKISPASDQYSLAAMAYQMLTGAVPFPGVTVTEVLVGLLTREAPPPSKLRADLSPEVDAVVLRGLNKDPDKRWESARAFTDAILTALSRSMSERAARPADEPAPAEAPLPTAWKIERPAEPAEQAQAPADDPLGETWLTISVSRDKVSPHRRRRLLAGAAAALVLGGSVCVGLVWSSAALSSNASHAATSTAGH